MGFFVRDCVRCGVKKIMHDIVGSNEIEDYVYEIAGACADCDRLSIYEFTNTYNNDKPEKFSTNIEYYNGCDVSAEAIKITANTISLSEHIPERIAGLFKEANQCRQMTWFEAAGAIFRKTLDVATKHIYAHDPRLTDKVPAQALRVRIKSLGAMKILDDDIVELADVAALDGNDATHDVDPYTKEEAQALEDLTLDLLDRLFIRPAKIAAVKAKQIAAGVRPA